MVLTRAGVDTEQVEAFGGQLLGGRRARLRGW